MGIAQPLFPRHVAANYLGRGNDVVAALREALTDVAKLN